MTTPDDLTSTRTHAHRLVEAEFLVGNKDSILSALDGRDREIEALRARVGWEVADKNEYTDRLRGLAADLAPFGCRPTMPPVKVLDYARVAIFDLIRDHDETRAALATARLDGARVMLDKVREVLADRFQTFAEVNDLDPAAVVGSGS